MTAGDVEAIAQLVLHERQGRDRGWWDRMRGQGDLSTHRLSPVIVDVAGA